MYGGCPEIFDFHSFTYVCGVDEVTVGVGRGGGDRYEQPTPPAWDKEEGPLNVCKKCTRDEKNTYL